MGKLLCARNRYIVPFIVDISSGKEFDEVVDRISNHASWEFQNMHQRDIEQDLYSVILDSFVMNEKRNNIGCSFKYMDNIGIDFCYTRFNKEYVVSISEVGLYIFRSGVGLFWYEAIIPSDSTIDELVLFQNEFKELSYERFIKKNKQNNRYNFETFDGKKPILMGHWVDSVISELGIKYDYFAKRIDPINMENIICDKALIFEYAIFDEESTDKVYDYIYRLTNGYNERYQRKSDFVKDISSPFDNAYYCATTGGCGYYAVPNESNSNFYLKTLKNKIMLDYFTLYILSLYQTYSILKFTRIMEDELPSDSEYYLYNSEDTLNVLKHLSTEINVFLVKSVYSSVSHINHQNDFYVYVTNRLRIKEDIAGLTIGLESLQKLQESRESERLEEIERQENQEREMSDDRINIGLGMLSVLAIISAIADGFGSSEGIVDLFNLPLSMKMVIDVAFMIIIVIVGFIAITSIVSSIKRARKKSKEYKNSKNAKN